MIWYKTELNENLYPSWSELIIFLVVNWKLWSSRFVWTVVHCYLHLSLKVSYFMVPLNHILWCWNNGLEEMKLNFLFCVFIRKIVGWSPEYVDYVKGVYETFNVTFHPVYLMSYENLNTSRAIHFIWNI